MKEKIRTSIRRYKKSCAILLVFAMSFASFLPVRANEQEASTEVVTTEEASTEAVTTEEASTEGVTTEEASTEAVTTEETSTEAVTTEEASTEAVTTEEASTEAVITEEAEDFEEGAATFANVQYDENGFGTDSEDKEIYQPAVFNDEEGVYEIANAGQLYWFAAQVNGGANTIKGKLVADIVINEDVIVDDELNSTGEFRSWAPIGNTAYMFQGTFDGNNYSISGIYVKSGSNTGLFGYTKNAEIKNLSVKDSYISGSVYVGGIVGQYYCTSSSSSLTNCSFDGIVEGSSSGVGGIAGYVYNYLMADHETTISQCKNMGKISAKDSVGGIVGYILDMGDPYESTLKISGCTNEGAITATGSETGGIAGYIAKNISGDIEIDNCQNYGAVTGTYKIGGIVGEIYGSVYNNEITLTNCSNEGAITATGSNSGGVGGIAGHIEDYDSENTFLISSCNNKGTINNASRYTGGIVGYMSGASGSTVIGARVEDCSNQGTITGTNSSGYTGGILGHLSQSCIEIEDCHNDADVIGNGTYTAGIVANCQPNSTTLESTLADCSNSGDITGTYTNGYIGGILANSDVTITACSNEGDVSGPASYIGGICGYNGNYTITDSYNQGNVTGNNSSNSGFCGGVSGYCGSVVNCYNEGVVSGTYAYGNTAGVVAYLTNSDAIISDCYNQGAVSGTYSSYGCVGGVVAYAWGNTVEISDSYNEGTVTRSGQITGSGSTYFYATGGVGGYIRSTTTTTVENCSNTGNITGSGQELGGIIGHDASVTSDISNCQNSGNISGGFQYTGGIVGQGENIVTIDTCSNNGTISIDTDQFNYIYVSGIIGIHISSTSAYVVTVIDSYNLGNISGVSTVSSYVGGIGGGLPNSGSVTNCYNEGNITGNTYAAGLVGLNYITVTESYNTGKINLIANNTNATIYAGGLTGLNCGTMTKSYNAGDVMMTAGDNTSNAYAGGLSGVTTAVVDNCFNTATVSVDNSSQTPLYMGGLVGVAACSGTETTALKNSYNTGTLAVTGDANYIGGLIGATNNTSSNSYYSDSCGADLGIGSSISGDIAGQAEAYSTEDFARGIVCYLLNSDENVEANDGTLIWYQNVDNDEPLDASPRFTGAVVYLHEDCDDTYSNYLEHIYVSSVTKAATVEEEGILTYTCTICGDSYDVALAKLPEEEAETTEAQAPEATVIEASTAENIETATAAETTTEAAETGTQNTDAAKTGDTAMPFGVAFIALLSAAGVVVIRKKRNKM